MKVHNKKSDSAIKVGIQLSGILLVSLIIIMIVSNFMKVPETDITKNEGEKNYYLNNVEEAIKEYNLLQEKDKWPIWKLKIAEIYSIQGETQKSSLLVDEALSNRREYIEEKGLNSEDEIQKDKEFINLAVLTLYINEEYEYVHQVIDEYMQSGVENKELLRTWFTLEYVEGNLEKAKEIIAKYPLDINSVEDIVLYADMFAVVDEWKKAISLLNTGWYVNKNAPEVLDSIESMSLIDRNSIIENLNQLIEEDINNLGYKLMLGKVLIMDNSTFEEGKKLVNSLGAEVGTTNLNLVKSEIYIKENDTAKGIKALKEILDNEEKDSYIYSFVEARINYIEENYEAALEWAKRSIIANDKYIKNYSVLVPEILSKLNGVENYEAYLRTALSKEPYNYTTITKLGDLYNSILIDNIRAREYYEMALKFKEDNGEVYYKLALILMEEKEYEKAYEDLEIALQYDNTADKYYRTLGTLFFELEEYDYSIEATRKAYELNPENVLNLNNAGCYYIIVQGNIEAGLENIEEAYNTAPSTLDEETKKVLFDNYNKAKGLYELQKNGGEIIVSKEDFKMFVK